MNQASDTFDKDIAGRRRYGFGRNWARFLDVLDEDRIEAAQRSLSTMLSLPRLDGKTFLDIGSGSGLFSLAARRLGASVTSFDFDPDSVACARRLKEQFLADDDGWKAMLGSVLDSGFMASLPQYDVVYSWGVLHHTGKMRKAIEMAMDRVSPGGLLFVALYRKTWLCPLWRVEKRFYVASPAWIQGALRATYQATVGLAYRLTHRGEVLRRGMDYERDVDDWLGGYPYDSITPRELKAIVTARGFTLARQVIKSEGMHLTPGCDEYVFRRVP
jgi:2-polyprenyl-3-methyl-5-hydroxy-6-metoxy-1,4-benzoquinol methylase